MEQDSSFTCCSRDCSQKFSSDVLLKAHKNKHDMVLSLVKTNIVTCDETPTPNTFIRDCEEVGLFQELHNVNPFEETFRKAAEAVRTGVQPPITLNFNTLSGDDTLHTPHVFPSVIETESPPKISESPSLIESGKKSETVERVVRQEADTSLLISSPTNNELNEGLGLPLKDNSGSKPLVLENKKEHENVEVLLRMPDGTLLQLSAKAITPANNLGTVMENMVTSKKFDYGTEKTGSALLLGTQRLPLIQPHKIHQPIDHSVLVKQKLKQALLNSKSLSLNSKKSRLSSSAPEQTLKDLSIGVSRTSQNLETVPVNRQTSSSTNSEEDPNEEKRRKALERNRAAAMRCREKRKAFVAELGRKANAMTVTNQALLHEVASLRAEVTRLKSLLLAHRDCPVTLATLASNLSSKDSNSSEMVEVHSNNVNMEITEKEKSRKQFLINSFMMVGNDCLKVNSNGAPRGSKRSKLSLDIEGAQRAAVVGTRLLPESPLVRSDEILSSVAPPTTPNETDKIITFNNNVDDNDVEVLEERPLATPVIQLNPNVIFRGSSSSTSISQGFS